LQRLHLAVVTRDCVRTDFVCKQRDDPSTWDFIIARDIEVALTGEQLRAGMRELDHLLIEALAALGIPAHLLFGDFDHSISIRIARVRLHYRHLIPDIASPVEQTVGDLAKQVEAGEYEVRFVALAHQLDLPLEFALLFYHQRFEQRLTHIVDIKRENLCAQIPDIVRYIVIGEIGGGLETASAKTLPYLVQVIGSQSPRPIDSGFHRIKFVVYFMYARREFALIQNHVFIISRFRAALLALVPQRSSPLI